MKRVLFLFAGFCGSCLTFRRVQPEKRNKNRAEKKFLALLFKNLKSFF